MCKFGLAHWARRPSLWICVGAIVLCLLPLSSFSLASYTPSILGHAALSLYIVVPATTAAVAWEASRFQSCVTLGKGAVRKIITDRILLFTAFPALGYVVAVGFLGHGMSAFFSSTFYLMFAYTWVVGISWVALGCTLGLILRPVVSVTLAAVLAYAWYAVVPSATEPGVIRVLMGDFLDCCSLDVTLDPLAVAVAAVVVVAATSLATGIVLSVKIPQSGLAAIVVGGLLLTGGVMMNGSRSTSVVDRNRAALVCTDEVCAWPEIPEKNRELNAQAREIFARIAPPEWAHYADKPVVWGSTGADALEFSGQHTVEGVVGDFVDYVGSVELARSGVELCGVPASELGVVRSHLPWDPQVPIDSAQVEQRLSHALCGM